MLESTARRLRRRFVSKQGRMLRQRLAAAMIGSLLTSPKEMVYAIGRLNQVTGAQDGERGAGLT